MIRPNTFQLVVTPEAQEVLQHSYAGVVVWANGLHNAASNEIGSAHLRGAEARARVRFAHTPPSADPHIIAMRAAYSRFGSKPSKYLCSAEGLLKRTLKTELPSVSPIVDIYNSVSLDFVIPVGGEQWDRLTSDLLLRPASGSEPFITDTIEGEQVEHPQPDELIWCDSSGVTCRRLNWRQSARTALGPATTNAYFVLDGLLPYGIDQVTGAAHELIRRLSDICPHAEFEVQVISTPRPQPDRESWIPRRGGM